jgi:hypothetical protein
MLNKWQLLLCETVTIWPSQRSHNGMVPKTIHYHTAFSLLIWQASVQQAANCFSSSWRKVRWCSPSCCNDVHTFCICSRWLYMSKNHFHTLCSLLWLMTVEFWFIFLHKNVHKNYWLIETHIYFLVAYSAYCSSAHILLIYTYR